MAVRYSMIIPSVAKLKIWGRKQNFKMSEHLEFIKMQYY